MKTTFLKLMDLLTPRERRNALLLFGMMLVMGLIETISVVSIMPFIAVAANPEVIHSNQYLDTIFNSLGFTSTHSFLLFLGLVVFVLVVGSLGFKALTIWAMARYTHMRNYSLSSRLLSGYLHRPYSFFLNRHSADLGKTVLSEVEQVINNILLPSLQFVANVIVAVFLVLLLFIADPLAAFFAVVVLGGMYTLTYIALRKYLRRIGVERLNANQQRYQIAQEAFGGIKEVKVIGLEDSYIRSFRKPAMRYARCEASGHVINIIPASILQGLVFGGMIILLLSLMVARGGDISAVLPLIALYAFSGVRLMPAMQQIYSALARLRFAGPALDSLYSDMVETELTGSVTDTAGDSKMHNHIRLHNMLELDHVDYTYPKAEHPSLHNLTLCIPAKTTVAFVGSTGAGKTTVVDMILGLLEPQHGELRVDGTAIIGMAVRAWQNNIGYVPQHIFLTDDTVTANIAFGIQAENVDHKAVERAARAANLHNFVIEGMPKGYATFVGERGVRLSGGQRQRIGIARALYNNPDVLVLDEATSALDNLTEKAVMEAVHNLGHRKTIIMIAHRLSTVRECDNIFMLESGQLVAHGTYNELIENCNGFRSMAGYQE